jgi:hypothetical protein
MLAAHQEALYAQHLHTHTARCGRRTCGTLRSIVNYAQHLQTRRHGGR